MRAEEEEAWYALKHESSLPMKGFHLHIAVWGASADKSLKEGTN